MMKQAYELYKNLKNTQSVTLLRMGDFYEAFFDDAVYLSKLLGLTLVSRDKDGEVKMVGFPCHQFHKYMEQIIADGKVVFMYERLSDASKKHIYSPQSTQIALKIVDVLSEKEWDSSTCSEIAEIVYGETGLEIKDVKHG